MAAKTSVFQEPNADTCAISKAMRAKKKKRNETAYLLIYLLAYFFILLVVVESAYAEHIFPQGKLRST